MGPELAFIGIGVLALTIMALAALTSESEQAPGPDSDELPEVTSLLGADHEVTWTDDVRQPLRYSIHENFDFTSGLKDN